MWYNTGYSLIFNYTFWNKQQTVLKKNKDQSNGPILWLKDITSKKATEVGGKAWQLAELYNHLKFESATIPNAFVIRPQALIPLLHEQKIISKIKNILKDISINDLAGIEQASVRARAAVIRLEFSSSLITSITQAFSELTGSTGTRRSFIAVRSSAAQESTSLSSAAGQYDSYVGQANRETLFDEIKKCLASWYSARAIVEREQIGTSHTDFSFSIIIQLGVDASQGMGGVVYSQHPDTKVTSMAVIQSVEGIGAGCARGTATADSYTVFKPGVAAGKESIIEEQVSTKSHKSLTNLEIINLTKAVAAVESYFKQPETIEWVKDKKGKFSIVQACPLISPLLTTAGAESYELKREGKIVATGLAIGQQIATGRICFINKRADAQAVKAGDIIVLKATAPEFLPAVRKAAAVIAEEDGRGSHAATIARELNIPCAVGVLGARKKFKANQLVTVSCVSGREAIIYQGALPFEVKRDPGKKEITKTKILLASSDPDSSGRFQYIPHDGIGIASLDFIFKNILQVHPLSLAVKNSAQGSDQLARIVGYLAASIFPRPLTLHLSDATQRFFLALPSGKAMEHKLNLRKAARGAERYVSKGYQPVVAMECAALQQIRQKWGITNVRLMAPFCRTPEEGDALLALLADQGVSQKDGWSISIAAEIPGNVMLAKEFATKFDGLSINLEELTPLSTGANEKKDISLESKKIVEKMIADVVKVAHQLHKPVSVTGSILGRDPNILSLAIKNRVDSVIVDAAAFFPAQTAIAYAERTVGKTSLGETNRRWLGIVTVFGFFAAGIMSVGAGCGFQPAPRVESQLTPAQIRTEIAATMEQQRAEEERQARSSAKVSGFANFTVSYPRSWSAEYSPDRLTIHDQTGTNKVGFFIHNKKYSVKPEEMTSLMVGGQPALMFVDPSTSSTVPVTIYEVELPNKSVLEIQSNSTSEQDAIINSVNFVSNNAKSKVKL